MLSDSLCVARGKIPETDHFTGLNEAAVLGVVEAGETAEFDMEAAWGQGGGHE